MNFDSIRLDAEIVTTNEFYTIYNHPDLPYMYDINFLLLQYGPTLEEFKIIEQHLQTFHEEEGLKHLTFTWPEDTGLTPPVAEYVEKEGYGLQMLELYTIQPENFQPSKVHPDVQITSVTDESFELFKEISFEQDAQISPSFAQQKKILYDVQVDESNTLLLLAWIGKEAVGGVTLFETEESVEIDSLFVRDQWQKKGIGSAIQQFVMNLAEDRIVLLAADADDSPKDMYVKQGYVYHSFQLSVQKQM